MPIFMRVMQLRPFPILAGAAGIGAMWGAAAFSPSLPSSSLPFAPSPVLLLLACGAAAMWLRATRLVFIAPMLCAAIAFLFTVAAHQRQSAPPNDLSVLVHGEVPLGPQQPLDVEITGAVASASRRSDFGQEFPFAVHRVRSNSTVLRGVSGTVWVRAPREPAVQENDVLVVRGALTDLPRAGNPAERESRAFFIGARCWCLLRAASLTLLKRDSSGLTAHLAVWRATLQERYEGSFRARGYAYPAASAQLLSAMILGDRAGEPLPRQTRDAFRSAGLTHLLVASGTQVALLCALVLGVGRAVNMRGVALFSGVCVVLLVYALLTGGAASIWRAVVAGLCVACAAALGRPIDRSSLLAFAFVALLCLDVAQIQDIGFQLTFAATWGLTVLAPALVRHLRALALPGWAAQMGGALLSAQLATLPFLLYHFGRAGIHGFAANALALPLAALLVGSGLLGQIWPPLNALNYFLTNGIRSVAETVAVWPGAAAQTLPVSLTSCLLPCIALTVLATDFSQWHAIARDEIRHLQPRRRLREASAIAFVLLVVLSWRWFSTRLDDSVRVTLLDVGQGESIVITRRNRAILIDGGTSANEGRGDVGTGVIVPYLQSRGVQRLDALVITHADADHCNGLQTVLREVPVGLVIDGAAAQPAAALAGEPEYLALRADIARRDIPVLMARAGQRLNLGDARLDFLAPIAPPLPSENDNAAVVRLTHGAVRMLFTADIEAAGEARLARRADIRCDVLKVAHHGSATSTGPLLLRAARPRYAMLSCGRYNSFGHPSPTTLARLTRAGIPILRTDRDGAISIVSDGRTCRIETFR
jgi:competence protein ComEC